MVGWPAGRPANQTWLIYIDPYDTHVGQKPAQRFLLSHTTVTWGVTHAWRAGVFHISSSENQLSFVEKLFAKLFNNYFSLCCAFLGSSFVVVWSFPTTSRTVKKTEELITGMVIKNGKVSWKVGAWSWSFLTRIRCKNRIKQPCIFQFCQFLTRCKTITF